MMNSNQTAINIEQQSRSTLSSASTQSSSLTCRICQDGNALEPLVNACDCSGSIGLVHAICLEKWLSQSARESCELCQFEFQTVKKVKNFYQFLRRPDLPSIEKHYILADTACFIILTPLGLASSYLCLRGANQYYNNNDFWAGFALVLLSTFLTLLYVFWVSIAIRYHFRSFREWQKESVEIRIVFPDNHELNLTPKSSLFPNNNNADVNMKEVNQSLSMSTRTTVSEASTTDNGDIGEKECMIKKKNEDGSSQLCRRKSIGGEKDPFIAGPSLSTKV